MLSLMKADIDKYVDQVGTARTVMRKRCVEWLDKKDPMDPTPAQKTQGAREGIDMSSLET